MEGKMNTKALTWDELANIYDKEHSGRKARTMSMDTIFKWAERQTDKFKVSKEGTIYTLNKGE
jgi:hypothetical protein